MKIYNFIGTPCYDIIIYLSILLKNMGKKVLVADYSREQEVMNCIEKPLDLEGMIHYNQVDYIGEDIGIKELSLDYDICLQVCAYSDSERLLQEFQELFIVTDTKRKNMEEAMNLIMNSANPKKLIIRDICDKRFGKNYFAKAYMGREESEGDFHKKDIHEIYFDELDYCFRIRLQHEVFRKFYALSDDLKAILFQLASQFSQMPMRKVKKAYKISRRRR